MKIDAFNQILNIYKKCAIAIYQSALIGKVRVETFCSFFLQSVTNTLLCRTSGMTGIFLLFRKFFKRDQYAFELF